LSDQEVLEKNEDMNRAEKKEKDAATEKFNEVPDETKVQAMNDQLGINLL